MDQSVQFTALLSHVVDTTNDYTFSADTQLAKIKDTLEKLDNIEKTLNPFGFEGADDEVETFRHKLERKIKRLEMNQAAYPKELEYNILALLQEETKLPAFVVYNLDDCDFTLEVEANEDNEPNISFDPELPSAITDLYRPAIVELAKLSAEKYNYNNIDLMAGYRGIVSPETRKKIQAAGDSELFDEIFVITDAPVWKINEIVITRPKAIVVGWVEDTEQMFVIDVFDSLPIEDYLRSQNLI